MTLLETIQIIIGFIGLTAIAIPLSNSKSSINYKNILIAILFQILTMQYSEPLMSVITVIPITILT